MQPTIYSMKQVAPTVAEILNIDRPAQANEPVIAPIVNDLKGVERLAIIAPDALGIVAWELWRGEMPFLSSLHAAHSVLLKSIMPSITPVNFACMLTGAELDVHGVKERTMDFRCDTLFDAVRRSGGQSVGIGHRGYSGELLLARTADIPSVVEPGQAATVAEAIAEVAHRDAPRFMIAQFGNVDSVFHKLGPSSPETVPMLRELDAALKRAVAELLDAGYGVIQLADHGQHDNPNPYDGGNRGMHGEDRDEDRLVPCTWTGAGR